MPRELDDDSRRVEDELRRRAFPFDSWDGRAAWARDEVARGRLEWNAPTEKLAHGWPMRKIARTLGISSDEVLARLVQAPPGEETDVAPYLGPPRYSLDAYRIQVEKFGPELVLETARPDLSPEQFGELQAFIESKERTYRWRGDEWTLRRRAGEDE